MVSEVELFDSLCSLIPRLIDDVKICNPRNIQEYNSLLEKTSCQRVDMSEVESNRLFQYIELFNLNNNKKLVKKQIDEFIKKGIPLSDPKVSAPLGSELGAESKEELINKKRRPPSEKSVSPPEEPGLLSGLASFVGFAESKEEVKPELRLEEKPKATRSTTLSEAEAKNEYENISNCF